MPYSGMRDVPYDYEAERPLKRKAYLKMPFRDSNDDEDDLFETVSAMADRMGLKGDKRATYVDDHMLQGGYQRVQSRESYARVRNEDDEDGGSSGNRWGFGGRSEGGGGGGRSRRGSRDEDDSF